MAVREPLVRRTGSVSTRASTAYALRVKKVAFKGTYKGTIKFLWNASAVTAMITNRHRMTVRVQRSSIGEG